MAQDRNQATEADRMILQMSALELEAARIYTVQTPQIVAARFSAEAAARGRVEPAWLTELLKMSFHNPWVLGGLYDCRGQRLTPFEVPLEHGIIPQLQYFSKIICFTPGAYVQRLLYHLYFTNQIRHSANRQVLSIERTLPIKNQKLSRSK